MVQQAISFAAALLERADYLCEHRFYEQALPLLERLLELEHVPLWVRREVLALLAEIELDRGRYYKARRHLNAALAYGPHDAHMVFLVGLSYEWQEDPRPDRAYQYYRRAATLDPENALYLAAQQCLRVELFDSQAVKRAAVRRLLAAYESDPDSPEVCYYFARGLIGAGKTRQAQWVIRRALRCWPELHEFYELLQRLRAGATEQPEPAPRLTVVHAEPSVSAAAAAPEERTEEPRILRFPPAPDRNATARTHQLQRRAPLTLLDLLGQWPAERRQRLATVLNVPSAAVHELASWLQNPARLHHVLERLSRSALECLAALCCRAVFTSDGYVTQAFSPCPNVSHRRQRRCLGELLDHGLVFALTGRKRVTFKIAPSTTLLIPTSLWPTVQSFLQQRLPTAPSHSEPVLRAM